jgi:hypothetical protein
MTNLVASDPQSKVGEFFSTIDASLKIAGKSGLEFIPEDIRALSARIAELVCGLFREIEAPTLEQIQAALSKVKEGLQLKGLPAAMLPGKVILSVYIKCL